MCWRMCLYGCFVLGIVRTWEVVSALRKVPRNLGSGVGKVPRFRYAFVWRSSEGVRGNLRAGPTGIRCDALAIRRLGLLRTKTKKLRGEHEGTRIGPLTGHMGRGRTSMTNTRRAKARRRFRNRRFRYVTRAAGRGQRCRNGGNLGGPGGGNRQSEGTKAKPRKPNDFNGFRGSNPGGGYEIRTREAVTPTRFPSVRHRPLGESSMLCSAQLNCVPQATRISYHRFRISARFGVARVATRM